MEKSVTILSLIANLITIGDLVYKIAFTDSYDYSTSISLVVVVVLLQLSFYYLLDLKISEKESYVSLIYYTIIPLIIAVSGWGVYKTSLLDIEHLVNLDSILLESFKSGTLIVIAVFLFLFWSKATGSDLYKKSYYLSFAFGIPSVLVFFLAALRYTFQNNSLDVHFIGFLILLVVTVLLAGIVKSTAKKKKTEVCNEDMRTGVTVEISTTKSVLLSIAVLAILLASVTEHWFIASLLVVVTFFSVQPMFLEKILEIIDKKT